VAKCSTGKRHGGSRRKWLRGLLCGLLLLPGSVLAESAFDDTPWADAAGPHGIAPALLYALALVESRRTIDTDRIGPWPWVIRTPTGSYWFDSRERAEKGLRAVIAAWPAKSVDVGIAQINLGWHAERFDDPTRLLDAEYNLRIAAAILADAVASTRDTVLGVGRYHHWASEGRARAYGERVWGTYRELTLGRFGVAEGTGGAGTSQRSVVRLPQAGQ